MTYHRRRLNALLADLVGIGRPIAYSRRTLEIGNGRIRRGLPTRMTWTLDADAARSPHVQADAHALPFRDGTLQQIVMAETLQYLASPLDALRECYRVLASAGRLLVTAPFACRQDAPTDRWRWTEGGLRALLVSAGFHVYALAAVTGRVGAALHLLGWRWPLYLARGPFVSEAMGGERVGSISTGYIVQAWRA